MDNGYKPHSLEWTDEKVARFWNFRNNYRLYDETWFTEQVGDAVLKFVNKQSAIKGKVLDYGTGKGFLVQHLLNLYPAVEVYACDFTDSVAAGTGEKFKDRPQFKGCTHITQLPSAYADNFFDVVFLIETIEHLTDKYLQGTLQELHRVLKPGGTIVITTPNDEVLEKGFVHCADCGASFHHMQHIRSWNEHSLSALTADFNFSKVYCKGMNLKWYGRNGFFQYAMDRLKKLVSKPNVEHLVYIGKKK